MSVKIGHLTFDRVHYDARGDVLYLHRADPNDAVEVDASPEGHALRFNAAGELIGVTIVRPRWLLEQEGEIKITIPEEIHLPPTAIEDALGRHLACLSLLRPESLGRLAFADPLLDGLAPKADVAVPKADCR